MPKRLLGGCSLCSERRCGCPPSGSSAANSYSGLETFQNSGKPGDAAGRRSPRRKAKAGASADHFPLPARGSTVSGAMKKKTPVRLKGLEPFTESFGGVADRPDLNGQRLGHMTSRLGLQWFGSATPNIWHQIPLVEASILRE